MPQTTNPLEKIVNRIVTRETHRYLEQENAKHPIVLAPVPRHLWPDTTVMQLPPFSVWRSRDFLMQGFQEEGVIRLSVNRTRLLASGRWDDQISWDDLMELKRQAGYGDCLAVEIFPRDRDIVNVSNMRHLWLVDALPFGFKK